MTRPRVVIEDGTVRPVHNAAQLRELVQAWDGTPADPTTLAKARKLAAREAERLLDRALATEEHRWKQGLQAQLEAARIRLLEELARYLVAWAQTTTTDLNQLLYSAMTRSDASADRLKRCFARLGNTYPTWPPEITTTLPPFLHSLTPNQKKSRLLGKELDAALNDPRWKAAAAFPTTHGNNRKKWIDIPPGAADN